MLDELKTELNRLRSIVQQVDDELVVNWISVKDDNYRKAIHDLVMWEIMIHDDPTVSEVARQRKEKMEALAQENLSLKERLSRYEQI